VPVTGTVSTGPQAAIGTIGTVQSQPNLAVASLVGSIGSPVAVAGGTVGTLQALANIAVASLVGSIGSPIVVGGGTVGTVQSLPNVAVASLVGSIGSPVVVAGGTIGTIQSVVSALDMGQFALSTILNNATVTTPGSQIITAATLQDMVLDTTYGTAYPAAGSVQVYVAGIDPLSGLNTGSIVGGPWVAGTVPSAHRITAAGPLGYKVGVFWNVQSGTITGVYISAQQSFGA